MGLDSGTTAKATNGDAAVTLLTLPPGEYSQVAVVNEGSVPGAVSIDGGTSWCRVSAGPSSIVFNYVQLFSPTPVQMRRVAGGSDMSGLWAWAR